MIDGGTLKSARVVLASAEQGANTKLVPYVTEHKGMPHGKMKKWTT